MTIMQFTYLIYYTNIKFTSSVKLLSKIMYIQFKEIIQITL